jgi:hypothetical protein
VTAQLFFRQERANTCAVAALRSVLASQFGVQLPETVLRYLGDEADSPILKHGTTTTHLRRMVAHASRACSTDRPWRLRCRRKGTATDLRRELKAGRFPLARVVVGTELHMIVVCAISATRIEVFDPAHGPRWMSIPKFVQWWTDSDQLTWWAVVVGSDTTQKTPTQ